MITKKTLVKQMSCNAATKHGAGALLRGYSWADVGKFTKAADFGVLSGTNANWMLALTVMIMNYVPFSNTKSFCASTESRDLMNNPRVCHMSYVTIVVSNA